MLQRQADGVEPAIQTVFSERVDLEASAGAVWGDYRLVSKIHGQLVSGRRNNPLHHGQDFVGFQHDRQDAVLEAVVVKNVGEARCDDATEALVEERPGGMFTRRSAAEVVAGQENRRALEARLI